MKGPKKLAVIIASLLGFVDMVLIGMLIVVTLEPWPYAIPAMIGWCTFATCIGTLAGIGIKE